MKTILAGLLLAAAGSAQAQATRMMMPEGTYDLVVGLAYQQTLRANRDGSSHAEGLPVLAVQWSSGVFAEVNTREALLGMHLSDNPMLDYGALLTMSGRDQRADTAGQRGGVALQAGGFVNWHVAHDIDLDGELLAGGGIDRRGLLAQARVVFANQLAAHHGVQLTVGVVVADHSWQQGYFGVTPDQAASGGNPVYRAPAGVFNYYGDLEWEWQWSNKYWIVSGARLSRLGSGPAASPLSGTRDRLSLRTAVTYHF